MVDDVVGSEERAVDPSASLLEKDGERGRRVREGLGVHHVGQLVPRVPLDHDLETHDSVFGEVLVRLRTREVLLALDALVELTERTAHDGLPPEERVGSRKHGLDSEDALAALVGSVGHFVLEELGGLDEEAGADLPLFGEVDLDLAAAAPAVLGLGHVVVELVDGVGRGSRPDVEHETVLGVEVLADSLEEPAVAVDLAVVSLFEAEDEVDPHAVGRVAQSEVPRLELEEVHDVVELGELLVVLHQFAQLPHPLYLWILGIPFHVVLIVEELLLVVELVLGGVLLEALGDAGLPVAHDEDEEVVLVELERRILVELLVALEDSPHRGLKLVLVLVVHGDADGELEGRVGVLGDLGSEVVEERLLADDAISSAWEFRESAWNGGV